MCKGQAEISRGQFVTLNQLLHDLDAARPRAQKELAKAPAKSQPLLRSVLQEMEDNPQGRTQQPMAGPSVSAYVFSPRAIFASTVRGASRVENAVSLLLVPAIATLLPAINPS